jgi:hypothetical protein
MTCPLALRVTFQEGPSSFPPTMSDSLGKDEQDLLQARGVLRLH